MAKCLSKGAKATATARTQEPLTLLSHPLDHGICEVLIWRLLQVGDPTSIPKLGTYHNVPIRTAPKTHKLERIPYLRARYKPYGFRRKLCTIATRCLYEIPSHPSFGQCKQPWPPRPCPQPSSTRPLATPKRDSQARSRSSRQGVGGLHFRLAAPFQDIRVPLKQILTRYSVL